MLVAELMYARTGIDAYIRSIREYICTYIYGVYTVYMRALNAMMVEIYQARREEIMRKKKTMKEEDDDDERNANGRNKV